MSFGLLNMAMLAGLLAMALPVIAHLLSKRKFDVVQWGAMQFLELGRKTRRKIRLQDMLLLLLRMALIGLVALALARPWGQGGLFGALSDGVSRDVVFVLDGSYSMGWEGKAVTPYAAGIDWIHEALEDLQPGHTAGLIDARTKSRHLVDPPATDLRLVREQVNTLAAPSGTSNLSAAVTEAMQILSSTSNVSREVIVLTDGQRLPWRLEDQMAWQRLVDLKEQPAIPPKLFVVNVGSQSRDLTNFSVDPLQLSRSMTVPDFPIRIRTTVRQSGGENTLRNVFLEVNGQRLQSQVTEVSLLPNGEALVELEHRFDAVGSYVVGVSLDGDNLPADNRAEAVVTVADGIPVLLVDGDSQLDETRDETFFLKSAFASSGRTSPWVRADVVKPEALSKTSLTDYRVVMLCNVPQLTEDNVTQLNEFVVGGGGLVIAPGNRTNAAAWNALRLNEHVPLLPLQLDSVETDEGAKAGDARAAKVTVDHQSLQLPWLERFRKERGVDFAEARFSQWWLLKPLEMSTPEPQVDAAADSDTDDSATVKKPEELPPVLTLARLSTEAPLLVSREWGDGEIMQLAGPLDADWGTLPARSDFVPFVHELVFVLTKAGPGRNVDVGAPLLWPLPKETRGLDWVVSGPGAKEQPVAEVAHGGRPTGLFAQTALPGVYYFHRAGTKPESGEPFVVDFDRAESNLRPLDDAEWAELTQDERFVRLDSMEELTTKLKNDNSRTELWWLLLFGVLGLLVFEVALTRQMVKGGHAALDVQPA